MSDSLPEMEYLEELKRIKTQALALSVDVEALRQEQRPESLKEDSDLSELLRHLDWDLQEAWETAKQAHQRVEILLAMQGYELDSRDRIERDTD